ncbi:MAG: hypothetical protein B6242_15975 [Anaerolineaceae bacterium 4572_78]|nr:MAG: hypothetical protein B6242_15975 [Anaerolineaceae bacterium 4572_78]
MTTNNFSTFVQAIQENISKVIIGKHDVVELLLVSLLADGHVLLEDVPGVGKTTLAKALARSLDCSYSRIQFTPDLLPSDVMGINYFNQKIQEFEFRSGPVTNQILLADEINRATPRTQSSLLEAMQERQVTIDGERHVLPHPFLVMATQNPIELEGTFPLPEAQVDRFLMQLQIGYPTREEEEEILITYQKEDPLINLKTVVSVDAVLDLQENVKEVHINNDVRGYLVDLVRQTREHPAVKLGISPRGTLALFKASQALAAIRGRNYIIPSDIQMLSVSVLAHRLNISQQSRLRGQTAVNVIREITKSVPVPVME